MDITVLPYPAVSEDAGIEPRTFAKFPLPVAASHLATAHPLHITLQRRDLVEIQSKLWTRFSSVVIISECINPGIVPNVFLPQIRI